MQIRPEKQNPFENLLKKVDTVSIGIARFYRVDLHVHSPESLDWPRKFDAKNKIPSEDIAIKKKTEDEQYKYFKKAISEKSDIVDALVITDHHKSKFADNLSRETSKLLLLPGIEINVKANPEFTDESVHLLAIFSKNTKFNDIERIFPPKTFPSYDDRKENTVYEGNIGDLIKNIHDLNGIVIAAHVNSSKGLRALLRNNAELLRWKNRVKEIEQKEERTTKEEELLAGYGKRLDEVEDSLQKKYLLFLHNHDIDAVQITKPEDKEHYDDRHLAPLGISQFPCVMASDAHTTEDVGKRGHCTHIKLTKLDLNSIVKAFKDPGARIRYDDQIAPESYSRIKGIHIEGGFFDGLTFAFSDNLTCLIGTRGSGKSALIDALRFVFNKKVPTDPDLKGQIENRQRATLNGSIIQLLIEDAQGNEIILQRRYVFGSNTALDCFDGEGNPWPEITEDSEKLAVDLYGWSEIEKVSHDIESQRDLIDYATPDIKSLKDSVVKKSAELRGINTKIVQSAEQMNLNLPSVKASREARAELERLRKKRKSELGQQDKSFRSLEKEIEKLESKQEKVSETSEELKEAIRKLQEDFSITFGSLRFFSKRTQDILRDVKKNYKQSLKSLRRQLTKASTTINKELKGIEKTLATKRAKLSEIEKDEAFKDYRELLNRSGELAETIRSKKDATKNFVKEKKALNENMDLRRQLIEVLLKSKKQLTSKRIEIVNQINNFLTGVNKRLKERKVEIKTNIKPDGDRGKFIQQLQERLKGVQRHYKDKNYSTTIAEKLTPSEFVDLVLSQDVNMLTGKSGFDEEKARDIINHLTPITDDKGEEFNTDKFKQLLALDECYFDDAPEIYYNDRTISEGLSPGQKCTAILPVIFLRSATIPLIIDQPEDNLDSQLIFELVVDTLRSLKEKRQIIVATHNPNIPVSGDAEQIVVLDAESENKSTIIHQASVDDEKIIENVKNLLEGGDDAFKIRGRKYGFIKNYI